MTKTSYKIWKIEKKKSEYTDFKLYLEDLFDPYLIADLSELEATLLRLKGHYVEKAQTGSDKQNKG